VINGFQCCAIVFNAGNVVLGGFCAGVGRGKFSDFFACGGVSQAYFIEIIEQRLVILKMKKSRHC